MAARDRAAQAGAAARAARSNPYIKAVLEDEQLRENARRALESTRAAYGRLQNGKGPAKLMDDKKLQRDVKAAASSLREATEALRSAPQRRKPRRRLGRVLLAGIVGAGLALVVSEGLRNKVLDALLGAEEEFEYTSTTTPAPPPATVPA